MSLRKQFVQFDGGIYFGQVTKTGDRQGFGIMLYNDDSLYQGEWHEDSKLGIGFEQGPLGSYHGQYFQGLKHGAGTFYNRVNGEVYKGEWANDCRHGLARIDDAKGNYFEGCFAHGLKNGFGVMYKNDVVYQGAYKNGVKHGMFVFYKIDSQKSFQVEYRFGKEVGLVTKKGYKRINHLIDRKAPKQRRAAKGRKNKTLRTRETLNSADRRVAHLNASLIKVEKQKRSKLTRTRLVDSWNEGDENKRNSTKNICKGKKKANFLSDSSMGGGSPNQLKVGFVECAEGGLFDFSGDKKKIFRRHSGV